jgi:hypothetical protein
LHVLEIVPELSRVTSDLSLSAGRCGVDLSSGAVADEAIARTTDRSTVDAGASSSAGESVLGVEELISQTLPTTRVSEEGLVHGSGGVEDVGNIVSIATEGSFILASTISPGATFQAAAVTRFCTRSTGSRNALTVGIEGAGWVGKAGVLAGIGRALSVGAAADERDRDVSVPGAASIHVAILLNVVNHAAGLDTSV